MRGVIGQHIFDQPDCRTSPIGRARRMDRSTAAGKVAALNFLLPYVQRLPDRLLRSEWATRIASELRVDEPVFREALRRAAVERRSEVKLKPELLAPVVKPAERRLIQMLVEAEGFREKLALEIVSNALHRGDDGLVYFNESTGITRPEDIGRKGFMQNAFDCANNIKYMCIGSGDWKHDLKSTVNTSKDPALRVYRKYLCGDADEKPSH